MFDRLKWELGGVVDRWRAWAHRVTGEWCLVEELAPGDVVYVGERDRWPHTVALAHEVGGGDVVNLYVALRAAPIVLPAGMFVTRTRRGPGTASR